jgi:uncharacterized protein (TIGR02145 family)
MERLPVTSATATAGTVTKIQGNDKGIWVIGNARSAGSFSATVHLLTDIIDVAGACAYASNYPPVGEYIDATHISFKGTPMYEIVLKEISSGGTLTDLSGSLYPMREGYIVKSFTDATGAPGIMNCIVPDNPTGTSNSRCGAGEVTISASSPSTNTVIDWYAATGGTPLLSGNDTYTTPSIGTSTTYYAQARDMITHCVSAARTPVVATVNVIPTLTLSSAAIADQTVDQNTPIANIIYTASNATIALSSGGFPAGVSGTSSGNPSSGTTFTISGTPTAVGTFNYSVTATHTDGVCTSTLSGAISVIAVIPTPPHAASTKTWVIGNQVWSDAIAYAPSGCSKSTNNDNCHYSHGASHFVSSGTYMYDTECIDAKSSEMCPAPWRLPTTADFNRLDVNLGFSGLSHDMSSTQYETTYKQLWGAVLGHWYNAAFYNTQVILTCSEKDSNNRYKVLIISASSSPINVSVGETCYALGRTVRCVRN